MNRSVCKTTCAYLINGTGKAWAWQSIANEEPSCRTKILPFESDENVGLLNPTGSYCGRKENNLKRILFLTCNKQYACEHTQRIDGN